MLYHIDKEVITAIIVDLEEGRACFTTSLKVGSTCVTLTILCYITLSNQGVPRGTLFSFFFLNKKIQLKLKGKHVR